MTSRSVFDRPLLYIVVVVLLICFSDWNYIREGYFISDEILFYPRVIGTDWYTVFWSHPITADCSLRYRPIQNIIPFITNALWGAVPEYEIAFMCILRIAVAVSVILVGKRIFKCMLPLIAAACMYVFNPVFMETYYQFYISQIMVPLFVLWAWYFYDKYLETRKRCDQLFALMFNLFAVMCNEIAFMLPCFLLLYGFLKHDRDRVHKGSNRDMVLTAMPYFITTGIFIILSSYAGGLRAYQASLTFSSMVTHSYYLFLGVPRAFLDCRGQGALSFVYAPYKIIYLCLWVSLLVYSFLNADRAFIRMIVISIIFYLCFMIPVVQLSHLRAVYRFVCPIAGLSFCAGSLFMWAEKRTVRRTIIFLMIMAIIFLEYYSSSISFWENKYAEAAKIRKTFCPKITEHIRKYYPNASPGSVFILLTPNWQVSRYLDDYMLKLIGGHLFSQYLFVIVPPRIERGKLIQSVVIPEVLWDYIWCEPLKQYSEWPRVIWRKKNDTSITFRDALKSEVVGKGCWKSRDGMQQWSSIEVTSIPSLADCKYIGRRRYYLKIASDGQIADMGSDK